MEIEQNSSKKCTGTHTTPDFCKALTQTLLLLCRRSRAICYCACFHAIHTQRNQAFVYRAHRDKSDMPDTM